MNSLSVYMYVVSEAKFTTFYAKSSQITTIYILYIVADRDHDVRAVNMIRRAVQLSGRRHIKHVKDNLLITDFKWQTNQFIVEILDKDPRDQENNSTIFNSPRWYGSSIYIIGVLTSGFLAYSDHDGTIADLLYIDKCQCEMTKIEEWDLRNFWLTSGTIVGRPDFWCTICRDESLALIIGPSWNASTSWGCRILDIRQKRFVRVCIIF